MGKLTDKLERAEKGAGQPLGFGGAAKRESIAPLLLLGTVAAGDAAQAGVVTASEIDGALIAGAGSARKTALNGSVKALGDTLFGVWTDEGQSEEAGGADFQVFSSDATPAGALSGEGRTLVMQVQPELPDSLLRTIDPVAGGRVPRRAGCAAHGGAAHAAGPRARRHVEAAPRAPGRAARESRRRAAARRRSSGADRRCGGTDRGRLPRDARDAARTAAQVSPAARPRALRRDRAAAVVRRGPLGAPPPPDDDDDWDDD